MSRKAKSAKNLAAALIGQSLGLIVSFIARMVFIRILGSEYLGLNGLFSNILSVLSLAELGVGEAITYSLYKPLAEKDYKKSKALMNLYKKVYMVIGATILLLGMSLIPLLPLLIDDMPVAINNIYLIYSLFVINTGVSYFFSYKRNLIIADQNRYIVTVYRYFFYFLLNIFQIIYILITKDYIGFLILQILFTIIENVFVSNKANKIYPFLGNKEKTVLDKTTKRELIKNTKAMMMHRVGGTIVSSTDNILLSKFVGLIEVGLYSNYYLIINAIYIIFGQFYSSILASVGNLFIEKGKEAQYKVFRRIDFLGFVIHCIAAVCLINIFNTIITLWVGSQYVFASNIVTVIVINFYISGMRRSVLAFREASGLFYKDRWKAIIEAIVNIVASIILATKYGTIGVFLGTLISSVTVCVWVEPYILFKYAFSRPLKDYFKQYFKYLAFMLCVMTITLHITKWINGIGITSLILKTAISFMVCILGIILVFRNDESYIYYKQLSKELIIKIRSKRAKKTN